MAKAHARGHDDFRYLYLLQKRFKSPSEVIGNFHMSFSRKEILLERWRQERTRMLMIYGSDLDCAHDKCLEALERALQALKEIRKEVMPHAQNIQA